MNNQSVPPLPTQIAFVFNNVADYQALAAGFAPGVEVHVLDASQDGLLQMAAILDGRSGLAALHVVGHGAEGELNLGSVTLDGHNMGSYSDLLGKIGASLAPSGDLLLYGCDVAESADGQQFIASLSAATGADVAASIDPTGAAGKGGNWTLESHVGTIDVTALDLSDYQWLLGTLVFANDSDAGMYTAMVTKHDAGTNADFTFTTPSTDSVYWDPSGGIGAGLGVMTMNAPTGEAFDLTGVKATLWGGGSFTMSWTNADGSTGSHVYTAGDGFDPVAGFTGLTRVTKVVFSSADAAVFGDFVVSNVSSLNSAPVAGTAPSITGTVKVGSAASATTGSWTDADNDTLTYSYKWFLASDASGTGKTLVATASSYTPVSSDAHKYLSVEVMADDGHGHAPINGSAWTQVQSVPSVSSIVRAGAASSTVPASGSSVQYTVTFSESVTGVDTSDFGVTKTGTAQGSVISVLGSGTTYTVTVGSISGDGTLRLDLNSSGTGIQSGASIAIGSGYTSGQTYTLDHTAPANPSAPDMTSGTDSGSSNSDNITSNTAPTFTGTAETGSTVKLYDTDGTTVLGTTTATGGSWSIASSTLSSGSHNVSVTATDAAGNTSALSSALAVIIDTTAPTAIGLSTTQVATTGATSTASIGTLSATDSQAITYSLAAGNGTNDADNGSFTIAGTSLKVGAGSLSAGTYKIYVAATDAAGNVAKQAFTITVADVPSVSSIVRAGGAASLVNTTDTSLQYTVTFSESVTGVDASDFALTATGTASGSITSVAGSGTTYTVTVGNISGDGTVRLDLNGAGTGIQNGSSVAIASGYTSGQTYTLDHTAPSAPSAPDMTAATDTGASNTDNLTSNVRPTFSGTAESGSTVKLYDGSTLIGTTTAVGGTWSLAPSADLADGAHTITAKAVDAAGNLSGDSSGLAITIDHTAPVVTSVGVPAAAMYKTGQVLSFTVNASEAVVVDTSGGSPQLSFVIGSSAHVASYVSGSGTTALQFQYTVQDGDMDVDGIAVTSLSSNGATLKDGAGNALATTLSGIGSTSAVLVDAVAPNVDSVSVPAAGTYHIGQNLDLTVNFSENVVVDSSGGTPRIVLNLDSGGTVYADYISGSGTGTLVFRHTVAVGEFDSTGITVGALSLHGGTIRDAATNDSDVTLNSVGSTALVKVDGTLPSVQSIGSSVADGAYKAGATITIDVHMDRSVTVDTSGGVPTLALSSGGTATYSGGSGTSALSFTYVVGAGENAADLDATSSAALSLNGATVKDAGGANTDANMTLPVPGASGSLGLAKNIVIDTVAPAATLSQLALSADTGASGTDFITSTAAQTISATLGATLAAGDIVYGSLDNGATWTDITAKVSGTTLAWNGVTLAGSSTIKLRVTDTAGNDGAVAAHAYTVDTTASALTFGNVHISADTGYLSTDYITNAASQTITATLSGALSAGDIVYGSTDGGATWADITAKVSGTSLAWDGATLTGSAIKLKVSDAAGNDGAVATQSYVLDTTAPAKTGVTVAFSSDTGASGTDLVTNTAAQTVSGTLSAPLASGEIVYVSLDNGATWAMANAFPGQDTWTLSGQTLAGSGTLKVKVSDTAGNDSAAYSHAYVLDTLAPGITIGGIALSSDSGASSTDFVTNVASQTISATLSAALGTGDVIYGSLDNGATWTDITAKVSGTSLAWNGVTLAAGGAIKFKVSDLAGNDGAVANQAYTLDTSAPSAAFTTLHLSADTGASASDFVTNAAAQTISATLNAALATGDKVYGSVDGGATWTDITAKVSGTALAWDGATLAGSSSIKLKVTDAAGNDGTVYTQGYVLDTAAPAGSVTAAAFSNDTGTSGTDLVTNSAAQTISGTLSAALAGGETVYVSLDGGANWTAATASGTSWSLAGRTLSGSGTLQVKVTDSAGNDSAVYSHAYVLDTAAPANTFANIRLSVDSGDSATDFLTNSAAQTIGATLSAPLAAGDIVVGSLDGGATWTDISAKVSGTTLAWDGALLAGSSSIKLKVSDAAGNDGTVAVQAYVLDTVAPAAPGTPALTTASDSGTRGDGVTETAPVIEGTALANAKVDLYDGANKIGTALADATGKWSIAPVGLLFGTHSFTARQYDAAGNLSAASTAFQVRYERPGPPTTLIDGVQVGVTPVTLPGGQAGTSVAVPVVPSTRAETSGNPDVADIPLASTSVGSLLTAQIAPGYGLSATGGTSVGTVNVNATLIGAIKAVTSDHTADDQGHLTGNGQAFLSQLGATQPLLVETIVPVAGTATAPAGAITLNGSGTVGQSVALVIDSTHLPQGSTLQLQNVDFAAVIGAADVVATKSSKVLTGDAGVQHFTVETGGSVSVFAGGGNDTLSFGKPAVQGGANVRADIVPGQGVTLLHGGQGTDTATFNGARVNFNIEFHNGYEVVSSKAEPNVKALVVNVEQLSFADTTVAISNGTDLTTIAGLYQSIYGRQADLYGFEFWADAHQKFDLSWGKMAMTMIDQSEWNKTHEGLNGNAGHDVQVLYNALFGRAGDAAGLDFWVGAMHQYGLSLEQVADYMVKSPEMNGHQRAVTDWNFLV